MSGGSEIEELRQLIEYKKEAVKWWKEDIERYTKRIRKATSSDLFQLDLRKQLELRKEAMANAEAELQELEPELTKSDETGVITEAGLAAVNAARWYAMERGKIGGMATRKNIIEDAIKEKQSIIRKKQNVTPKNGICAIKIYYI